MKRSLTVEFKRVTVVMGEAGIGVINNIDTYRLCAVLLNNVLGGHTRLIMRSLFKGLTSIQDIGSKDTIIINRVAIGGFIGFASNT